MKLTRKIVCFDLHKSCSFQNVIIMIIIKTTTTIIHVVMMIISIVIIIMTWILALNI